MKCKTFFEYPSVRGFDQYASTILGYNNIKYEDISTLLPDLQITCNLESYFNYMEPIDKGDDFVKLIIENKNKRFCVIGDYDCDGIMATTIMTYGLTLCGIDCTYTVSNRFITGYGMHKEQIDEAINAGAEIIITVDNGITANEAIDYAHSKGLKVFVTDHHTPQGENHAEVCVDPLYNNDKFKEISGATVAMKLMYLLQKQFKFDMKYMRDFAACAGLTVMSDVMPMLEENRILVKTVLDYMNFEVKVPGSFVNRLSKLVDYYVPGKESDPYLNLPGTFRAFNKDNIDFYFVPVINATNRVLGDVNDLIYDIMSLFSADYNGVPHLYSGINKKRKFMRTELKRLHKPDNTTKAVVEAIRPELYDDNYSGIVGLVASDVVESENKPALIGIDNSDNDVVHFSGRSLSGFNLFEALGKIKEEHPELSLQFGGHAEALGASCTKKEIPLLQQYLSEKVSNISVDKQEETYFKLTNIDYLRDAYYTLYPFGNKFEFPKFYVESTIKFLYKEDRTFILSDFPNTKIKFYDKATMDKLAQYAFKNRSTKLKCVVSFAEDENDVLIIKLNKLL